MSKAKRTRPASKAVPGLRTARPWPVRPRPAARSRTGPQSRPGSPEEDLRLAAASRSRLTVEASKLPDNSPILRSSSTSSAPLPRCTERLRRSTGSSSIPCIASSASILAAAFGAVAARVSGVDAASGSEKPVELVRLVLARGRPEGGAVRSVDAHRDSRRSMARASPCLWLTGRKRPGKICRRAAVLPVRKPRHPTRPRKHLSSNINHIAFGNGRGTALA